MSKEELKIWFWDKFNNCYIVKHEKYSQSYFMFYDKKYIRYKKFARLTDNKIEQPNISEGICLFEQDYENGYFHCEWDILYTFFVDASDYFNLRTYINDLLKEANNEKLRTLRTKIGFSDKIEMFKILRNKI